MNPILAFWIYLKASLFSTGGFGNLPSIHSDMIARHWATERQFAESLMIGQLSPGPNGFWVLCLGYLTDGVRGALLALLAINLPPLLILVIERIYRRVKEHPAMEGFVNGLGLAVTGVFGVTLFSLLRDRASDPRAMTIALAAFGLGMSKRIPLIIILGLAAAAGVLLGRMH